ncbi:MAG: lipoprotein, partial [Gammaproteobacteria bacterium]|nr:lipoprotein [Gammaproteobacteria bacterium]
MYNNKRSVVTMMNDNDASNAVLKAIDSDSDLRENTHVSISTRNQLMLIAGQAATETQRNRVYQIASQVPNLKRIYNEITIEPPSGLAARSVDTWITTKVKTALLAEKGLQSNDIKVVTENKVVYLMGLVTPGQAEIASRAASEVSRVQRVVKIFEYQQ